MKRISHSTRYSTYINGDEQVDFSGLTGTVKFDKFGLRRDYSLDVLEVSTNRGMAKVREVKHVL